MARASALSVSLVLRLPEGPGHQRHQALMARELREHAPLKKSRSYEASVHPINPARGGLPGASPGEMLLLGVNYHLV